MRPLVSVITVVKNSASSIAETIESVLSQDYAPLEYVVIDGGSSDGTVGIIEQYRDRISIFASERDDGVYFGMQKGVRCSTGSMILLMNAGDIFVAPHSLSFFVESRLAYKTELPVVCYADFMKFYPKLGRSFLVTATDDLHRGMGLCRPALLADRAAYDRVGEFDFSFRLAADYEWAVRARRLGVHFLKAVGPPTAVYRHGGMSDSHYRASRAEAGEVIRREYGWAAYARYTAMQRWRFYLRKASELFKFLFGARSLNWLHVAYLRVFRGHRALNSADR